MVKKFENRLEPNYPSCPRIGRNVIVDREGFCKENPKRGICEGCWSNDLEDIVDEAFQRQTRRW